jgi:hypothetical protein
LISIAQLAQVMVTGQWTLVNLQRVRSLEGGIERKDLHNPMSCGSARFNKLMGIQHVAYLLYQQGKLPSLKLQSARRLEPEMHLGAPGVSPTHSPLPQRGV